MTDIELGTCDTCIHYDNGICNYYSKKIKIYGKTKFTYFTIDKTDSCSKYNNGGLNEIV